jgi:endonuclease YncB( thermonuclease family)
MLFWLVAAAIATLWIVSGHEWRERSDRLMTAGAVGLFVLFWINVIIPWNDDRSQEPPIVYERVTASSVRVVDMETLDATIDDRRVIVHLIGVDEVAYRDPDQNECVAADALPAFRHLVEDRDQVTLEIPRRQLGDNDVLAYVWADDDLVNLTLLAEGHVGTDSYSEHERWREFNHASIDGGRNREARCPFPTTTTTTTTRPRIVNVTRYQPNQYGCHSDGRCLDDYDTWCDSGDLVYFEPTGEDVCYETYEWLVDDYAP